MVTNSSGKKRKVTLSQFRGGIVETSTPSSLLSCPPPSQSQLETLTAKAGLVLHAFPEFRDSDFSNFGRFLTKDKKESEWKRYCGPESVIRWYCVVNLTFERTPIILQIGSPSDERVILKARGHTWRIDQIGIQPPDQHWRVQSGGWRPIQTENFFCEDGMVHVIFSLAEFITMLKNRPECIDNPLYSTVHCLVPYRETCRKSCQPTATSEFRPGLGCLSSFPQLHAHHFPHHMVQGC